MNTGGRRAEGTEDPPRIELPINQIAIRVKSVRPSPDRHRYTLYGPGSAGSEAL